MTKMSSVFALTALALVAVLTPALPVAADMDPAWLAGTWEATAPSPAGAQWQDKFKLIVKPDGTFEEDILSVRGGRLGAVGKWKVSGESVIFDGTYVGGTAAMNGTRRTVTLKKSGDNSLEGTRLSHFNNMTLPIAYTRAK